MRSHIPSFWPLLGLGMLLASCSPDDQQAQHKPADPGQNFEQYGEERIGYKGGNSGALTEGADGDYNAFLPPTSPGGDNGANYGDGDSAPEFSEPLPSELDAGVDAGEDAGLITKSDEPTERDEMSLDDPVPENPFRDTNQESTSTFSIDVDTGSYTLARASIRAGHRPDPRSVRVEEFINYFHLHYKQPTGDVPLSVYSELGPCPWNPQRELLMLGIQGQEVKLTDQPPANLVFLLDVSGSMAAENKLPLLKKGFRMLVHQLRPQDRVSIVTYAGRESVVLENTSGSEKETILAALDNLSAGGSTNGAGGIQKAYELATAHFIQGGNNRVLLATDGDFNVGLSGTAELVDFIAEKRKTGVFLSVYGFGDAWDGGNYKDSVGEQLADNGDGIYFYIDSKEEARRAFIHTISGSLLTVAKDVKVQVEFNPQEVRAYRLIGYENRLLANEDFGNDNVDAGELGAGLSVTALFELIPAGSSESIPQALPGTIPNLELSESGMGTAESFDKPTGGALVDVRLRYKKADQTESQLIRQSYGAEIRRPLPSLKFWFAAGVSEFAMRLRNSQYLGPSLVERLREQIGKALSIDAEGAVREFFDLVTAHRDLGE